MPQIDILSGQPTERLKAELREQQRSKDQEAIQKAMEMAENLKSPEGQIFFDKVREHLATRIQELVENDPECKALLKVLDEIGTTIELGKSAAERIAKRSLRMESNQ